MAAISGNLRIRRGIRRGEKSEPGGRAVEPWWRRQFVPLVAVAVVLPLYVLWAAVLATGGGDLAAQFAWSGFTERHPDAAYNLSWYGGTHTANYSLIAPHLMAAFGVRAVSVAAGLAGTWLLAVLFVRSGVRYAVWPAVLASLTLWCNIASGRTTFTLGVALGLIACLYAHRTVVAVLAGALATMASPVAGLFVVVVGAAYLLGREWRKGAALMAPFFVVLGVTTLLFPFRGEQPMASGRLWMPLFVCAALILAAPPGRGWRIVRFGAGVYALGVVLTFLIASPIGTNVERLFGLISLPLLLAAALDGGRGAADEAGSHESTARTRVRRVVLVVALVLSANWLAGKTAEDLGVSNTVPAWAADTDGVVRELARLGADRTRVEVVPARNHREATALAPHVNMARGWNRQLDVERGRLFYDGTLTPTTYRQWLDRWAVGFVVLHHGRPDGPAEAEAALVRSGPEWLEQVWRDDGWTVYRVKDATPLVSPPGVVVRGSDADLVVRMPAAGSVTVRIAHSPWLRAKGACLRQDGEWTRLTVPKGGTYRLDSAYRVPRQEAACGTAR